MWSPLGTEDLPQLYQDTALARTTLTKYVITEVSGWQAALVSYRALALPLASLFTDNPLIYQRIIIYVRHEKVVV